MTPPGKVLTGLIALTSLGTISTQVPVFQICCALLGLLIAAEVFGIVMKPDLTVEPIWPRTIDVGFPVAIPVRITNNSTWRSAYDVMVLLLDRPKSLRHLNGSQFIGRMQPQETVEVKLHIRCLARGQFTLNGIDAHSTFPFNLIRVQGGRSKRIEFVAVPTGPPLVRFDLPVDEGMAAGQFVLSGNVGESTEYLGNREYSPGEPVRRLDFRAWARLGKPVVREYQDEHASRIGLIVDTLLNENRFGVRRRGPVEEVICLSVSIIEAVIRDDYQLAWMATATDLDIFPNESQSNQQEHLIERLGMAIPTSIPVYSNMVESVLNEADHCAAIVVVLGDWDPPRQQFVEQLIASRTPVKVVLVSTDREPPETLLGDDFVVVSAEQVQLGEVSVL